LFRHTSMDRVPVSADLAGEAFPKYFISDTVPMWDPAVRGLWKLEVSGAVKRPFSLTLDELQKLPRTTQKVDHFCVEGWNARAVWSGVRMSEIAKMAGVNADAQYVDFAGFDQDYHESWDMESAMHPQTLIAYGMDGHLLGPGHGAPARVHSPVKLGYKNTKYLTKIVFMPERNGGYWSDQGYEWYGGT
jgi:DMSO/TMAO reductase YedYZ molybdopterin-dependent catalytic subunit